MDVTLTQTECRVLGSLIEKELTTPEYYPLSLNALVLACNQKSNRDPVMALDEQDAELAVDGLRSKLLAWVRHQAGARVPKYEHNLAGKWQLSVPETAVLCELLVRGPQTMGELRTRASRMHPFASLDEVQAAVRQLAGRQGGPFVAELARRRGEKECRYAHLLAGEPTVEEPAGPDPASVSGPAPAARPASDRTAALEQEVASLKSEIAELRNQFEQFRQLLG